MDLFCKSVRDINSPFDCLLFDLDDTLYSSNTGIAQGVKRNIEGFLVEKSGFSIEEASKLRIELFKTYGSTLAGLRVLGYDVDADDYHSYVHGRLPYDLIKPDIQLKKLLESITQRKLIFTNSDRNHAIKVLERLGLEGIFDEMICFESINPNLSKSISPDEYPVVLKPSIKAMRIAIDIAQVDPRRTLFLDDNVRNIAAGKSVGLCTVLVGQAMKIKEADYVVDNIVNLKQAVPEIWISNEMDGGDQRISHTRSEIGPSVSTATPVGA